MDDSLIVMKLNEENTDFKVLSKDLHSRFTDLINRIDQSIIDFEKTEFGILDKIIVGAFYLDLYSKDKQCINIMLILSGNSIEFDYGEEYYLDFAQDYSKTKTRNQIDTQLDLLFSSPIIEELFYESEYYIKKRKYLFLNSDGEILKKQESIDGFRNPFKKYRIVTNKFKPWIN